MFTFTDTRDPSVVPVHVRTYKHPVYLTFGHHSSRAVAISGPRFGNERRGGKIKSSPKLAELCGAWGSAYAEVLRGKEGRAKTSHPARRIKYAKPRGMYITLPELWASEENCGYPGQQNLMCASPLYKKKIILYSLCIVLPYVELVRMLAVFWTDVGWIVCRRPYKEFDCNTKAGNTQCLPNSKIGSDDTNVDCNDLDQLWADRINNSVLDQPTF